MNLLHAATVGTDDLYFEPKSGTIEVSQTTQNAAMLSTFGVVSQVFRGDVTMSDFNPNCVLIPLSKRGKHVGKYTAIVSPEDADLADFNWMVSIWSDDLQYACRNVITDGKRVYIYLHRAILERKLGRPLEKHELADHINGNGLDSRRENLRLATLAENNRNIRKSRANTSGVKGVSWDKQSQKWCASIKVNGRKINLGLFKTFEVACEVRRQAAIKYHGDFANHGE